MIRVVHPGSGSCFFYPDPGWSRGQKGTGSRIRNTDCYNKCFRVSTASSDVEDGRLPLVLLYELPPDTFQAGCKSYEIWGWIFSHFVYVYLTWGGIFSHSVYVYLTWGGSFSHSVCLYLKGQCHEIFDFRHFFMNQFPPSPWVSH